MSLKETIASIHQTTDQIIAACQGLSEEALRWKPNEESWSVQQVLCHLEEAIPYWLRELQTMINSPETPWGRGLQHEGRLAAVSDAHERKAPDVLQGLAATKQQVQDVLGSLREEDLQLEAQSRNPRFGTKPLSFIVDHLLTEHLITHLKQIERNIGAFN
ncbi:hypothetical protein ASG89_14095 [Paenibacillus sp. Soil766]|uniref:DinB family protein n=1 Tax=Paenibacillus sp. Soil766 TaxID=1736404 RepID=UPI00070CDC73|nr:DinB family protein [Paenibacillus sp. Soil766]KRE82387.1 hypothetical protein ASG89_14095 [Paenibacillus sp. Soil766]